MYWRPLYVCLFVIILVELENRKKLHKNPCMSFLVGGMIILPKEKILDTLVKKLVIKSIHNSYTGCFLPKVMWIWHQVKTPCIMW